MPTTELDLPIYLDHHATTPVDPRVLERMLPYFGEHFGNAASRTHRYGWEAAKAVERARSQVAGALGASSRSEIVFTSGATEANNLALRGLYEAYGEIRSEIIVSEIEHPSVLDMARSLERFNGATLKLLPVSSEGLVDPESLRALLGPKTLLVSVMAANNEVGTLQPLGALGAMCREAGAFFHTDAVQALGKIPFQVDPLQVDLASVSAHKLYGPKGIGALFLRRRDPRARPRAQMLGGGHERGFRSGTLAVPLIVGFGEACALAQTLREEEALRLGTLRDQLLARLRSELGGVVVHGSLKRRLPGNLNLSFEDIEAEPLLLGLRQLALSSGSACSSATPSPSHVLRAMGISEALAHGSLRFGLGRSNTEQQLNHAASMIIERVRRLRAHHV